MNLRKSIEIKQNLFLLFTFFVFTLGIAQQKIDVIYQVGEIPEFERFQNLTAREVKLDSIMHQFDIEKMKSLEDGSAFIDGVPEDEKQEMIEHEKILMKRYKDNRSRYFLESLVNNQVEENVFSEGNATITTECSCYLSGDTIKVKMGIWVFGGFEFKINIHQNKFNSSYWEDLHEQPIFKTKLTDKSLVDNVLVPMESQSLILENQPKFQLDEMILGYFEFKTQDYFRTSDYEIGFAKDTYNDKQMDKLNMMGSLYFNCKVRKRTFGDD